MLKRFLLPISLASFLFVDAAYSQISSDPPFRGDTAGIVNGRVLTRKAYVEQFIIYSTPAKGEKPHSLSEKELSDAHKKTWESLVINAIVEDSIEKKGIVVTDKEVWSVLENDPPAFLKPSFTDSAGMFHSREYHQALHDLRNDTLIRTLIVNMKPGMQKQKFSEILFARVPQVTDEELWQEYKDQKGASRKNFEAVKEKLRTNKSQMNQQTSMSNWIASAQANAKIVDYRTIK